MATNDFDRLNNQGFGYQPVRVQAVRVPAVTQGQVEEKDPTQFDWSTAQKYTPEGSGVGGFIKDVAVSGAQGLSKVAGDALAGIDNMVTGGKLSKAVDEKGLNYGDQLNEYLEGKHTEELRRQQFGFEHASDGEDSMAGRVVEKGKHAIANPRLVGTTIGQSAPDMVASAILGRKIKKASGGRISDELASGIGEGAMMMGHASEDIRKSNEDQLLHDDQKGYVLGVGATGTLFSWGGGKLAKAAGVGDIDTLLTRGTIKPQQVGNVIAQSPSKSVPRQMIEGAITEGFLEELPQEVSETILTNLAKGNDWAEGIEDSIVMAPLAGFVMGGGAAGVQGYASRQNQQPQAPTPSAPQQTPAQALGINPNAGMLSSAAANHVNSNYQHQGNQYADGEWFDSEGRSYSRDSSDKYTFDENGDIIEINGVPVNGSKPKASKFELEEFVVSQNQTGFEQKQLEDNSGENKIGIIEREERESKANSGVDTAQEGEQQDSKPQHVVKGYPIVEVPLADLKTSKDVAQFKEGANERGVVEPLEGTFDRRGVAPIQVFRRKNGELEVISGRHRFDLALRSGEETIPAQIHDESDDFTVEDAKTLDATLNIRDGQGSKTDFAKFFRQKKYSEEEAKALGFLGREKGRDGFTIGTQASDEVFSALTAKQISEDSAAAIAEAAPNDSALQAVGLEARMKGSSIANAVNTIRAVKAMTNRQESSQDDLFGFDTSAMKTAQQMAKVASQKQRKIAVDIAAIRGPQANPQKASELGALVEDEAKIKETYNNLIEQKQKWERWETHPELIAEINAELGINTPPSQSEIETQEQPFVDENQGGLFGDEQEKTPPAAHEIPQSSPAASETASTEQIKSDTPERIGTASGAGYKSQSAAQFAMSKRADLKKRIESGENFEVAQGEDGGWYIQKADKKAEQKNSDTKEPRQIEVKDGLGKPSDGKGIAAGDIFSTSSGRTTTPYPKGKSDKQKNIWIAENATAEAESRGDDFNALPFRSELEGLRSGSTKSLPPASLEEMVEYLFGQQPEVIKPFVKPMEAPSSLKLEQETEQSIKEREAKEKASKEKSAQEKASQEKKEKADKDAETFNLTGSDNPADVAMAQGQKDIFADGKKQESKKENDGDANVSALAKEGNSANSNTIEAYKRLQSRSSLELANKLRKFYSGEEGMRKLKEVAAKHGDKSIADIQSELVAESNKSNKTADNKENVDKYLKDDLDLRRDIDKLRDSQKNLSAKDIASMSLSEIWSLKDIQAIEDNTLAAMAYTLRSMIPAKPRVAHKKTRWANHVKEMLDYMKVVADSGIESVLNEFRKSALEALNRAANQVEILAKIDRNLWSRISDMQISKVYPDGSKDGEYYGRYYVDGKYRSVKEVYRLDDVAKEIEENVKGTNEKDRSIASREDFAIYTYKADKRVFASRTADKEKRPLKFYDSVKDAREALKNQDELNELAELWENIKAYENINKGDMRRKENRGRIGKDWRGGKDATSKDFVEDFGLRGVDFGNWVNDKDGERQEMLNDAYDALADLAEVLGIPNSAMGLNGKLLITLGKRGMGNFAAAHFERKLQVINLTKTKGAGSLAHEWFHALDNHFARYRDSRYQNSKDETAFITYEPEPMMVHKSSVGLAYTKDKLEMLRSKYPDENLFSAENWEVDSSHPSGVRAEVETAFANLVKTLNESNMMSRAKKIDGGNKKGYWGSIIEVGARAFENYVIAKLESQGLRNDYLANVASAEDFAKNPEKYPYIYKEEMGDIETAFDGVFSSLKTKESDGVTTLFRRGDDELPSETRKAIGNDTLIYAYTKLSTMEGAFQLPAFKYKDMSKLIAANFVSAKMEPMFGLRVQVKDATNGWEITTPDGRKAYIYENNSKKEVWIDVSELEGGENGKRIYNAVANYAYNNKMVFVGDPDGLSDIAMTRRLENMISSALKFGTVRHIMPHERQVDKTDKNNQDGKIVPVLNWQQTKDDQADFEANLRNMIVASAEYSSKQVPKILQVVYNPDKDVFEDNKGNEVTTEELYKLAGEARLNPDSGNEVTVGGRTLERAIFTNTILSTYDKGDKKGDSKLRGAILARLGLLGSERLLGSLYRKTESSTKSTAGLEDSDINSILGTIAPNLKIGEDILVFNNINDLFEAYPEIAKEAQKQNSDGSDIDGVAHKGKVLIVRSRIKSAEQLEKILFHEGTHVGIDAMMKDSGFNGKAGDLWRAIGGSKGFIDRMNEMGLGKLLKPYMKGVTENYSDGSPKFSKEQRNEILMQELLAFASESLEPNIKNKIKEFFGAIRAWLRRNGFLNLSNMKASDIVYMARRAKDYGLKNKESKAKASNLDSYFKDDTALFRRINSLSDAADAVWDLADGLADKADGFTNRNRGIPENWTDSQKAAASKFETFMPQQPFSARLRQIKEATGKRFMQLVFDQFRPLSDISQKAFMQAHLSRGSEGTVEAIATRGVPYLKDGAIAVQTDDNGFMGKLAKLGNMEEINKFLMWVAANRAESLFHQNRENLFTMDEINAMKDFARGTLSDGRVRRLVYQDTVNELNKYNKAVLDIAEEAGLVDPLSRATWEDEFYIPFYRVMMNEDGTVSDKYNHSDGGLMRQNVIQRLKGGTENLGDPLENILSNWNNLISSSMKNMAANEALIQGSSIGVSTPTNEKSRMWTMVDGQRQYWEVHDKHVVEALESLNFNGYQNDIMKVSGKFKRIFTMGVTLSPTFRIRSLIRDTLHGLAVSDIGYNPVMNVVEGWKMTDKESEQMAQMIAGGGAIRFGAMEEGQSHDYMRRMMRELNIQDSQILDTPTKFANAIADFYHKYQEVGDRLETVNRAAVYARVLDKTQNHLEASFAARDVMNYTSMGSAAIIRVMAQVLPFFNARMQGLNKLQRGAHENPARFWGVVSTIGVASALLYLLQADDDDYTKLPDHVRDTYWAIKMGGTWFYVPKPFEVGVLATVIERGTELAVAGNDYKAEDFKRTLTGLLINNLSLNPVPQVILPLGEAYYNYDMFRGAPIESAAMQKLLPEERYDAKTSSAAIAAGRALGVSPKVLEHLITGYLGWVGTQILNVSDILGRSMMDLPSSQKWDMGQTDNWFIVGDFLKDVDATPSKYVTRYYEVQRQISQMYETANAARKIGDGEKYRSIMAEPEMKARIPLRNANKQMANVNQQIRKVVADRNLKSSDKTKKLNELYERRNKISQRIDELSRG